MSCHFILEPEVAGGWGENTEFTRSVGQPTVVHKLHYEFQGWLGDELLESTPCYVATERLIAELERANLTGFKLDHLQLSRSAQFEEFYPDRELPKFLWLKIVGAPGVDDFGMTSDLRLMVSERALAVLQKAGIANAIVTPSEA